nr:MAG TPA: hypothetical protein [Caudoviricetes sp.]
MHNTTQKSTHNGCFYIAGGAWVLPELYTD